MNRNDIAGILAGLELTDAQVKGLLDLNSADITKALNRQKDDLTAANDALAKARETITALEANKADADALQKQIDDYKAADEKRKQEAQEAAQRAELEQRFNAVSGDRKYLHEMVRAGVMADFGKALQDKANRGKGDKEIFDDLTRDKGYFASQNPPADMGPVGNISPDDASQLSDQEYYARLYSANQNK